MASENGWEPSHAPPELLEWRTIPGTNPPVSLRFMKGWPSTIMTAFAADYNAYVEHLRDGDSAAFTPTNSVATSNHLNGTAMDLNWNGADGKTFRLGISEERAYPGDEARNLRELLAFYENTIFCGGNWSIRDWMHMQMGGNTWNKPWVADFILRKIRADGFSTYKRTGVPPPPPPPPPPLSNADQYALAIMAEGRRRGITPRGIQIAFSVVFVESGWKMYANSNVPESLKLPHDAVGSDHDSVGLFQQRHPMWGPLSVLMNPAASAGLFYDRLVKMDYNNPNRLPGDFAADIQRPAAQYRGRYQERMGDAVTLYNRLAGTAPPPQPPPSGDDMALVPQDQWNNFYNAFMNMYHAYMDDTESLSPARRPGEGKILPIHRFVRNIDGSVHLMVEAMLSGLRFPDPDALALLNEVANVDLVRYPERARDQKLARAILAERQPAAATDSGVFVAPAIPPMSAPVEQQIVYLPAPVDPAPATNGSQSTGQIIGEAYDALEKLRLADALPIESRAPLAALIAVLQTKNGSNV